LTALASRQAVPPHGGCDFSAVHRAASQPLDSFDQIPNQQLFDLISSFFILHSSFTLYPVFQVIFNPVSAAEMSALPKDLQLDLLAEFQILPSDLDALDGADFGVIRRDGRTLHRYRCRDHRIYFEKHPEGILIHRVLHRNTIRDFLFRSELPMTDDDQSTADSAERTDQFWKMIHDTPSQGQS